MRVSGNRWCFAFLPSSETMAGPRRCAEAEEGGRSGEEGVAFLRVRRVPCAAAQSCVRDRFATEFRGRTYQTILLRSQAAVQLKAAHKRVAPEARGCYGDVLVHAQDPFTPRDGHSGVNESRVSR